MEHKKTFEPFEKVLTKNKENDAVWSCHFFSHYENDCVILVGGMAIELDYTDIIPFAGNETLVGTSYMPEEEITLHPKDLLVVADSLLLLESGKGNIRSFIKIENDKILAGGDCVVPFAYIFCIPFSQFNPNDLDETRKHILCVKNGKLVRAGI